MECWDVFIVLLVEECWDVFIVLVVECWDVFIMLVIECWDVCCIALLVLRTANYVTNATVRLSCNNCSSSGRYVDITRRYLRSSFFLVVSKQQLSKPKISLDKSSPF